LTDSPSATKSNSRSGFVSSHHTAALQALQVRPLEKIAEIYWCYSEALLIVNQSR